MKDFLTIKEFSKLSGIERTTLRWWDEQGIFSPAKRDPENDYRYYTPEQIIAVNFITVMSSLGLPLKTIAESEGVRNPEKIVRLIEQQEKKIDMELRRLRECYSIIHTRREMINYGMRVLEGFDILHGIRLDSTDESEKAKYVDVNKIAILNRDDTPYVLGPRNEWKEGEGFFEPFTKFCNAANDFRINLSFPIGGYHDNWDEYIKAPQCPNHFISIDPTGNRKREEGKFLIGFSQGYYGQFGDLPKRLEACIEKNSLTVSGPVYTMYLHDEISTKDPSKYLAQICVAVSKKK